MSVHTRTRRTRPAKKSMGVAANKKSIPWREAFKNKLNKHSEGGFVLKGYRSKSDVTQKELAKALSIRPHHISEMENAKRPIGKEMAKRLAEFFKTDYRIFL